MGAPRPIWPSVLSAHLRIPCLVAACMAMLLLGGHLHTAAAEGDARRPPPASPPGVHGFWNVNDTLLLNTLHIPVQEVWRAALQYPGFEEVKTDEDQEEMNHWNDVDMVPWLKKAPLKMEALLSLATHQAVYISDTRRLVAIYKNKIYWLQQTGKKYDKGGAAVSAYCLEPCNHEFRHWAEHMKEFLSGPHKIEFPDVVFYLSVMDWPTGPGLPAPVLTYQKNHGSEDILVPILHDIKHPLYIFPWEDKVDKAFMRATAFCEGSRIQRFMPCARSYFAMRSQYENMSHILEAGLTTGFGWLPWDKDPQVLMHGPLAELGFFPFRDHARYRYLLDTDGMTGSYRASKLMFVNSPIFKQETPWFEWYTRSLKDGVHHIKFWIKNPDDIYEIIESHRHNETALQALSMNAMKFAYKYLTETPRKLYWRRTLTKFKTLFPDMDDWMSAFNWKLDPSQGG